MHIVALPSACNKASRHLFFTSYDVWFCNLSEHLDDHYNADITEKRGSIKAVKNVSKSATDTSVNASSDFGRNFCRSYNYLVYRAFQGRMSVGSRKWALLTANLLQNTREYGEFMLFRIDRYSSIHHPSTLSYNCSNLGGLSGDSPLGSDWLL